MVHKKLKEREYHAVKEIQPPQEYKLRGSRFIPSQDDLVSSGRALDSKEDSMMPAANSDQRPKMSQKSTTIRSTQNSHHSLRHKRINTKYPHTDAVDDKSCSSCATIPKKKKSSCCISVGEKVIIKQKLNKTDEPSDFTLVKGSIYIRKSAVDTGATQNEPIQPEESPAPTQLPDIPEEGEPGSKGVQVTNIKECVLCCEHLKCGLNELLHLCDSDPDAFIRQYENRNVHCEMREENSDERFVFQMDKTHGDVFGDPKYHYLMVDKSTLLNEEIPKIEDDPTDISMTKSALKKSARSVEETPPQETESDLPTFFTVAALQKTVEGSETSSESSVTSEKLPSDTEEDLQETAPHDTSIFVSTEDSEMSVHERHAEEIQLGDIQEQVNQPHRVSIIWDDAVDPISKLVKSRSEDRGRRVSAVSWSGVDNSKLAEIGKTPMTESAKKAANKNSIFESIVREERRKIPDGMRNRPRGKSLIEGPESTAQKKKWFGLKKTKRTESNEEPSRLSSVGTRSVIGSVVMDVDDVDSTYFIKESSTEETSGSVNSSRRNSLEAYRRRSVSVENPVFEKHREINDYLHNV